MDVTCPYCGHASSQRMNLTGEQPQPSEGHLFICWQCLEIAKFIDDNGSVARLDRGELSGVFEEFPGTKELLKGLAALKGR